MKGSTLRTLAAEALAIASHDETRDRDGVRFVSFDHNTATWETWMQDASFAAHDDGAMFPDDQRYEWIEDALYGIRATVGDDDDIEDISDLIEKVLEDWEAPVYTSELTSWLHSRNDRVGYVDDAVQEFGAELTLLQSIATGYLMELRECVSAFLSSLWDQAETVDNNDDKESAE